MSAPFFENVSSSFFFSMPVAHIISVHVTFFSNRVVLAILLYTLVPLSLSVPFLEGMEMLRLSFFLFHYFAPLVEIALRVASGHLCITR